MWEYSWEGVLYVVCCLNRGLHRLHGFHGIYDEEFFKQELEGLIATEVRKGETSNLQFVVQELNPFYVLIVDNTKGNV